MERLPRLSDFVGGMVSGALERHGGTVAVEQLAFDLPVELDLVPGDGDAMALGAAPPTQWVETSVMPVFQRMRLVIEAWED
jgi:hypothetical protein